MRYNTFWTKKKIMYLLLNPKMPISELSEKLGINQNNVNTERKRLRKSLGVEIPRPFTKKVAYKDKIVKELVQDVEKAGLEINIEKYKKFMIEDKGAITKNGVALSKKELRQIVNVMLKRKFKKNRPWETKK